MPDDKPRLAWVNADFRDARLTYYADVDPAWEVEIIIDGKVSGAMSLKRFLAAAKALAEGVGGDGE